ncbi:hypothetical protein HN385_06440 [archaeon]|nr:hypothetical protein [archaeon]MBT3450758.1 hypothetical protein [archaeon]MBT6869521.1 hypothetical protein [archaeon]MBT7193686.1 hypothetical protein [archaeon]MBT7380377.1 hypothetical protein [archaeon]
MNIKRLFLVLVLAGTLLFSACSGGTSNEVSSTAAFIGGTNGISVSFEPFSVIEDGVYTIYDDEDFPIEVVVTNLGEHTVEAGDIRLGLLGPSQDSFSNIPDWEKSNTGSIEEISDYNPSGGEEIISFTPSSYAVYNDGVIGYTNVNWNLNYDYDYSTYLIIDDVCFKGDVTDERVCEVQEYKAYSVSGAPITITSVEEDTGGKGVIVLTIDISNSGSGESTIIGEEFDDRFSQVSFEIEDPEDWECTSGSRENQARLVDGAAQIRCKLKEPLSEDDIYSKSVMLTVSYTYQDLITETLRIKESAD